MTPPQNAAKSDSPHQQKSPEWADFNEVSGNNGHGFGAIDRVCVILKKAVRPWLPGFASVERLQNLPVTLFVRLRFIALRSSPIIFVAGGGQTCPRL